MEKRRPDVQVSSTSMYARFMVNESFFSYLVFLKAKGICMPNLSKYQKWNNWKFWNSTLITVLPSELALGHDCLPGSALAGMQQSHDGCLL